MKMLAKQSEPSKICLLLFLLCIYGRYCGASKPKVNVESVKEIIRKNDGTNNLPKLKLKEKGDDRKPPNDDKIRRMGPASLQYLKKKTEHKIMDFQKKLNSTKNISEKEKKEREFKRNLLMMFLEELSESEKDMLDAQEALKKSLSADFLDSKTLMKNSKQRLDALRLATMKEEQSFLRIKTIEEAIENHLAHENSSSVSMMDELLEEIARAADLLEVEMDDHIMQQNVLAGGDHIEAVLHMKEGELLMHDNDFELGLNDDRLDVLVDSQNNKFILSRPNDMTSSYIDHLFVLDLIMIWMVSFPLSVACNTLNIPVMFGQVMAGLFLGPSGSNAITSTVQVESFGEFGVFLIMFMAGLEFSPKKLRKYWRVALQAPLFITTLMVLAGMLIAGIMNFNIPMGEAVFISSCLSLSSTPLVIKYLQGPHDGSEYSSILLGILIVQDILLSLIVAFLPTIAESINVDSLSNLIGRSLFLLGRTIVAVCVIMIVVVILARYFIEGFVTFLGKSPKEVVVLAVFFLMFVMQMTTNALGISMELGCFLAGVIIGMTTLQKHIENMFSPIHDIFAAVFFATVGLHIFPSFVLSELTMLIILTIFVVTSKYLLSLITLYVLLPSKLSHCRGLLSSGLAQVSEFSFVLSSRARHLKILSREVYLLILSVTTLSILVSPLLWKLSWWRYKNLHSSASLHTKA